MIGRAVILHEDPDDCTTQTTGNAGRRLAMCVIGIENDANIQNNRAGTADVSPHGAIAVLAKTSNLANGSGRVDFEPLGSSGARTVGYFEGLTGIHGFHVHTYGDLSSASGMETGGHYNPGSVAHSLPPRLPRHVGDLGNIYHYEQSTAWYEYNNTLIDVSGAGSSNILGRGVIVHAQRDICAIPSGDSGSRLLQGVVGHRNPATPFTAVPSALPKTQDASACDVVSHIYKATCVFEGTSNDPGIYGSAMISVNPVTYDATVEIQVWNVSTNPSASHAIHIHEYGDLTATDGTTTGMHWNPNGASHACPPDVGHLGDMGNWQANDGNISITNVFTYTENILSGNNSAVGRAIVIHEFADNCTGPAGFAGKRLAVCVIGVSNVAENRANSADESANGAIAVLRGTSNLRGATGRVDYEPTANSVRTAFMGVGLSGSHGFHVHQYGDTSSAAGTSAGGHFNPNDAPHGLPPFVPRHVGDLGNIYHYNQSIAWYHYVNNYIAVSGSVSNNIIGRANIVHANIDNCAQPFGAAGPRYLQGVIGHRNPNTAFLEVPTDVPTTQNASACPLDVFEASCVFQGTSNDISVSGTATLTSYPGFHLTVSLNVAGLTVNPDAEHAIHIHEYGDTSAADGSSTGGHWNPTGAEHGCPAAGLDKHWGDLGGFIASNGTIVATRTVSGFTQNPLAGNRSAIGRAIVIHELPDDCLPPTGAAGSRLAVCVLGVSSKAGNMASTTEVTANGAVAVLVKTSHLATGAGRVYFEDVPGGVRTTLQATGLTGAHGFHVHQCGDLTNADGTSAGPHFNPTNAPHAIPPAKPRHVGDLGNIDYYNTSTSTAMYKYVNDVIAIGDSGVNNIIGRGIIVHQRADNCLQPFGEAGSRYLMGVIAHKNPSLPYETVDSAVPATQNNSACLVDVTTAATTATTAAAASTSTASGSTGSASPSSGSTTSVIDSASPVAVFAPLLTLSSIFVVLVHVGAQESG